MGNKLEEQGRRVSMMENMIFYNTITTWDGVECKVCEAGTEGRKNCPRVVTDNGISKINVGWIKTRELSVESSI